MVESNPQAPHSGLFLAALSEEVRSRFEGLASLEEALEEILGEAHLTWPTLQLDSEDFFPFLAQKVPSHAHSIEDLQALFTSHLYLSCACLQNNPAALKAFEDNYLMNLEPQLQKISNQQGWMEEVKQVVREKLFVAQGEKDPKIASYAGTGDLRSWVRAVAVRDAFGYFRKNKKEVTLEDGMLAQLSSGSDNQELSYLKQMYHKQFRKVFLEAMATLSERERNLLRLSYLDGLNIDKVGKIYNVHRATVARWLQKAREALLQTTRTLLIQELEISQESYESIMVMLHSQLDASIQRFFDQSDDAASE